MLNAILNTIVAEKLYDEQYIQTYVEGFKAFAESIKDYTPEEMGPICGVEADLLRTVARKFARARSAKLPGRFSRRTRRVRLNDAE